MYDLEIVMCISGYGKYKKRLADFKELGLLDVKDHRVRLVLLTGTEKIAGVDRGWDKSIDVEVVPYSTDSPPRKMAAYYADMSRRITDDKIKHGLSREETTLDKVRWFMRVDDDSITDIDSLMRTLEDGYDYQRDYYLSTDNFTGNTQIERDIMTRHGYGRWFQHGGNILHETECCVVSQSAMTRIIENKKSIEILKERTRIDGGYTDICFAAVARLNKIYPMVVPFLNKHPVLGGLSLFGGSICHIHYCAHDKNQFVHQYIRQMRKPDTLPHGDKKIYDELLGKEYLFSSDEDKCIGIFTFSPDSSLGEYRERGECLWRVGDGKLFILDEKGNPSVVFNVPEGKYRKLLGISDSQGNPKRYLRKLG